MLSPERDVRVCPPRRGFVAPSVIGQRRLGRRLRAVESCDASLPGHLRFRAGDVIVLEDMPRGRRRGWALGRAGGDAGWFRMAAAVPLKLRQSK
jgi:hypothetical protein